MTYFLLGDYNLLPKKELHLSVWVELAPLQEECIHDPTMRLISRASQAINGLKAKGQPRYKYPGPLLGVMGCEMQTPCTCAYACIHRSTNMKTSRYPWYVNMCIQQICVYIYMYTQIYVYMFLHVIYIFQGTGSIKTRPTQ